MIVGIMISHQKIGLTNTKIFLHPMERHPFILEENIFGPAFN
jgi:hypothetical protein